MLKSIVMINCDSCSCTFEHLAVSPAEDPFIWSAITADLERAAENAGWYLYHHEHRCHNCMLQDLYGQQQKKQK
ncbi:MAG TPA: hypothetical protein VIJ14_00705 [Rhabdochlamydiaceae bacterium]